jgi:serine O-acetyltransferase
MLDNNKNDDDDDDDDDDNDLYDQLREEALEVQRQEPELSILLHRTILAPSVVSFEDAVASTVCYRLLLQPCQNGATTQNGAPQPQQPSAMFCPNSLKGLLRESMSSDILELGHSMADAIREDALAVCRRDPATDTVLEVVLFSKGYAALVCHRAAHRLYKQKRKFTALFLQSQTSAVFGLDIHPLAQIGFSVMLDHGTGVVVGETAVIGDGCTILHGVTLGGTGKDNGDRHPKVGKNVLIGAGASLLGNIHIGDGAKIGAGSVVLRAIPPGATAVGSPAKIIGRSNESRPGSEIDETLENVTLLHKSDSSNTVSTTPESEDSSNGIDNVCPYREYTRLAKLAPPGTVTICTLANLLKPYGCTANEIGACLFALDMKNVGYVHMDVFRLHGIEAIVASTGLTWDRAESITASFLFQHSSQRAAQLVTKLNNCHFE